MGRFEAAHVCIFLGLAVTANVIQIPVDIRSDAQVMEPVISEERAALSAGTNFAVRLLGIGEKFQTALRRWPKNLLIVR